MVDAHEQFVEFGRYRRDDLLAEEPDGKHPAGRERDRGAEDGLEHEDVLGMMT
jgi:hypothetical protein